jgi:serine/threonine-protein kinase
MYELLAGVPPFSGESPVAVAYQHVRQEPEPPSDLNPNVPPGLEAIVLTAMAKHPEDRYQTADDLIADLKRLLAGQVPLVAPQNEAPTRMMAALEAAGAIDTRRPLSGPAYEGICGAAAPGGGTARSHDDHHRHPRRSCPARTGAHLPLETARPVG